MKKIKRFLLLVLTAISAGCNPKPPYSIVFCDFSSSIDTIKTSEKIKTDAMQIFRNEVMDNCIDFYSISKDYHSRRLFRSEPLRSDHTPSEKEEFEARLGSRGDSLRKILDEASEESLKIYPNEPNSCIINCIERSVSYFEMYEPERNTPLHLYILSDMLECCVFTNNKKINLEPNHDIEEQISSIPAITDSSLSLKQFKNLRIHVVVSSNKILEGKNKAFEKFWTLVFQRYGYDIRNQITVELPRNFKDQK